MDLQEIKARLAAATPGPWKWFEDVNDYASMPVLKSADKDVMDFGDATEYYPVEGSPPDDADAELIAHAPRDIADLVVEVERLREALNETKNDLISIGGLIAEATAYGEVLEMSLLNDKLHEMYLKLEGL